MRVKTNSSIFVKYLLHRCFAWVKSNGFLILNPVNWLYSAKQSTINQCKWSNGSNLYRLEHIKSNYFVEYFAKFAIPVEQESASIISISADLHKSQIKHGLNNTIQKRIVLKVPFGLLQWRVRRGKYSPNLTTLSI